MKLKKGSLEAKRFMAKIRAKKGKPKATVNGWKKGNTRMLEVNEPVFKTKKNVRVKRRKLGTFKKFTTISGMKSDVFNKLEDLNKKIDRYNEMIKFYSSIKNTRGLDTADKKHYRYMANISKKHLKSFKEQINSLKKLI
tara:strand:+ start:8565 stop:8981 length:417 start_codon:yes stop_codon:yes gene_type:complete